MCIKRILVKVEENVVAALPLVISLTVIHFVDICRQFSMIQCRSVVVQLCVCVWWLLLQGVVSAGLPTMPPPPPPSYPGMLPPAVGNSGFQPPLPLPLPQLRPPGVFQFHSGCIQGSGISRRRNPKLPLGSNAPLIHLLILTVFASLHNLLSHFFLHFLDCIACTTYIHRVSKNVPPLACYNSDAHEWIWIFFVRNVTDKVGNQKTLYYATSNNLCFCTTWQNGETLKSHTYSVGLCYTHNAPVCYLLERKSCHL